MERQEAIERLRRLEGREIHELAQEYNITIYNREGRINKGWAGHVFERYLELPMNSAQSPNFGSWELKSIPIKTLRNGNLEFKETMAVTMIDPVNVMQKEFEDSHLLLKLRKAVVIGRTVGNTVDDPSYIYRVATLDLDNHLYESVREDYNLVRDALISANGDINTLSGRMGRFIQPRTKGAGHGSISRAFYARKLFLRQFFNL